MGKINRDELHEMLKGGKSQADCARHFQVSEAAISKAVKRLRAPEIPESMKSLTEKQQSFVLNLAEGKTATDAALAAYDCASRDVAKTMGCRMAKDPDVEQALSDIMAQEGIPLRRRIQRLRVLIESKDLSAVSKGLDMSWKLDGSYAPEKVHVGVDVNQLREKVREVVERMRADQYIQKPTDTEVIDVSPGEKG